MIDLTPAIDFTERREARKLLNKFLHYTLYQDRGILDSYHKLLRTLTRDNASLNLPLTSKMHTRSHSLQILFFINCLLPRRALKSSTRDTILSFKEYPTSVPFRLIADWRIQDQKSILRSNECNYARKRQLYTSVCLR